MYDSVTSRLSATVYRVQFFAGARILTVAEVLNLWRTQTSFVACFCHALAKAPFDAFFFEMPPASVATQGRAFECVIADAPALRSVLPDCGAFAPHFENQPRENVAVFVNLARDALLIAPSSCEPKAAYGHLAAFLRGAKVTHVHALWRAVGDAMLECIQDGPRWLSTSGLGVPWLHVRIDTRPKYYTHDPYRAQGGTP